MKISVTLSPESKGERPKGINDLPHPLFCQAIWTTINVLPIPVVIAHVKGHHDNHNRWEELDIPAQINILADRQANAIYRTSPGRTGLFPTWVPAPVWLFSVTMLKSLRASLTTYAMHTPAMKQYLIRHSCEGTGGDKSWDEATYLSIDWQDYGEAFKKLSIGWRIQLSKYTNNLLPTMQQLQVLDNKVDGRCFACNQLWEDTTHVLTCPCEARCAARITARLSFRQQLSKLHTTDIMSKLICDSMDSWLAHRPVTFPAWHGTEPIQRELCHAFTAQSKIGWDQFHHGCIAKAWQKPIHT
jgi:hypothetical protein